MPMRADSELTWDHSSSSSSVGGLANPFSLSLPLHFTGARRFSPSFLPAAVVGPVCRHLPRHGRHRRRRVQPSVRPPAVLLWPRVEERRRGEERRARERALLPLLRTCTKTLARLLLPLLLLRPQQRQKQEMADRPRRQLLAAAAAK